MFEPPTTECWKSANGKQGAHYNIFSTQRDMGMTGLRQMFPDGEANEMNFCLFSTSGVHGMYTTIEEAEETANRGNKDEEGEEWTPEVTFLICHPRIVCMRYGNCNPETPDDFAFLKKLRQSSWDAVQKIGAPE